MGSATDYFENLVLDACFGDDCGVNMPATVYVALFTSTPDDGGTGTEVTSVGTGYARVAVTNNTTNFPASFSAIKTNGAAIQFPTAAAAWGDITHWAFYDAATSGNMLIWGELATPISPIAGNAPYFEAGSLNITCD